jgi:GMP synthase (glutamine-hydrolysing)
MHILIVDNETIRLKELISLLKNHKIQIKKRDEINSVDFSNIDLVILSGGSNLSIINNEDKYQQEIELIRNSNIPIIGICLGFQLIAYVYGSNLIKMDSKYKKIIDIKIIENNDIFNKLPNFKVYEAHRWKIDKAPENFIVLAESDECIQVIKHKNREIYGFQFHPEMLVDKTCGDEIFYNLISKFGK